MMSTTFTWLQPMACTSWMDIVSDVPRICLHGAEWRQFPAPGDEVTKQTLGI